MSAPDRHEEMTVELASAHPASTEPFRLGAEPPQVMRLSRKALAILGAASGIAIGGALLYAFQPGAPKVADNLYDSDRPNTSEIVTSAPGDYGKVPKLGEPLPGDLGRPILAARKDGENIPVSAIGAQPADPRVTAAEQARARAAQERETAHASQLFLGGAGPAAASMAVSDGAGPQPVPAGATGNPAAADKRSAFLGAGHIRPAESGARLIGPSSPHIIQAGSVIPAALLTGIQSDLPGQVTAQVTQNVYDSLTGRILLIPQGARLIGEYDSDVSAGQNRVLLAWDRVLLPGGRSLALDRLPGGDAAGMAGLADRTNYHWGGMLKAAFVSTLLGVGAELGASDEDRIGRAIRRGAQDSVAETGRQVVDRELGIRPTITIRPGFSLRVIVTRDLILEPIGADRK